MRALKVGSVHITALALRATLEPMAPTDGTFRIRPATPQDIEALAATRRPGSDSFHRKIGRGREVWVVEQAGTPVAYDICGAKTKALADWISLEAPEGDTWAIGIWVAPEARGRGLAVHLRRRVAQELQSHGFIRLLGTISVTNRRSIRTFEKLGVEFIGRVDYIRLFGFGVVGFGGKLQAGRWTHQQLVTLAISPSPGAGSGADARPHHGDTTMR